LDTYKKTTINKFEFRDSSRTLNGGGKFKFTTKEGVGIGVAEGVQGWFCLDV